MNFSLSNSVGTNLKTNFIVDYGKFSSGFNYVDELGNQKFNTFWPIVVLIVGIILSAITFIGSKPKKDEERNKWQKILFGLTFLLILCSVCGAGYGIYLYFAIYLPEYRIWFDKLPPEAKSQLSMISTIDTITKRT